MSFQVLRLVCPCIVMLKQDLCWIFVRSDSFETLFEFCQLPDVGIWVDCFFCWHHIHKNYWHHLCWLKDRASLIGMWCIDFHQVASAHFSTSGVTSETRWPEWGISWSSAFPVTSCHFRSLSKGASVEGSTSINIEKVFVDASLTLGNKEFCNGTLWQHIIGWLICEVLLQGCCQKSLQLCINARNLILVS